MSHLHSMLQLFADAAENTGVTAPAAEVQGVNQEAAAAQLPEAVPSDPDAEFDRLIRGQFKDQYNARVQDIVRKRLKSQEKTLEQYRTLESTVAKQYGIQAKDPQALSQAIEAQQLSRESQRSAQAKGQYEQWMWQAQQAKKLYPNLDLNREVRNPRFMRFLHSGVDVGDAYLLAHRDEIIPAAMQFAAQTVEKKISNKIIANGARPTENGMSSQASAVVKSDVSQLSRADRDEIRRRVARGEKISF